MTRRTLVVVAAITAMTLATVPASAQDSGRSGQPVTAPHADLDNDGLTQALEAKLRRTGAGQRIDVIVSWNGRPDAAAAQAVVGGFDVVQEFSIIDGFLASVTPGQARALARVPGVERIDDNFEVRVNNEQTDQDYGTEQARIDFGVDGSGVDICVLDTGADPNHEQLDTRIVDFFDAINGQSVSYDDNDHGTHVAGTIAGDGVGGPDASRYQGIAPGASLYIAKVLSGAGTGTTAQIINGIEWCIEKGVDVMSASLGTSTGSDGLDPLSQAVNNAVLMHQIAATIAAGNSGDGPKSVGSPGAAEYALTVGAGSKFGAGLHLAPFSSRGPNLAGINKPDVISPGVAVVSADAGTVSGYFAASGTSMATPFTAGAVALALQANPVLGPADVKNLVTTTARDAGPLGVDKDYGYGFIDGYALVAAAQGTSGSSSLPTHTRVSGNVADSGLWSRSIPITGADVGKPIGITILIDGALECSFEIFGICLIYEWSPDLDARLISPDGTVIDSRCALEGNCGSTGVQETFQISSADEGTYTLEVYPFDGTPNNGVGGAFDIDIFTGSAGTAPPANVSPIAYAGPDQTVADSDGLSGEQVTLDGSASTDDDGTIVSYSWSEDGSEVATGVGPTLDLADGVHNITLTVVDDDGASDSDVVVVTVEAPQSAATLHVGDLDGSSTAVSKGRWQATATVTVHDETESAVSNATITFDLSTGSTVSCTTDANGQCSVNSPLLKKGNSEVTFTVTGITGSLQYDPDDNHDPDGDSDGSSLTLLRG